MPPKRSSIRAGRALALALAVVTLTGVPARTAGPDCPKLDGDVVFVDTLWNADLDETSGIQASQDHPGVMWVIEDSGNGPWMHAYSTDGRRLATYQLTGPDLRNVDWEAIGLDHRDGADLLYIGDVGDNRATRDGVERPVPALYRFPEPSVEPTQSPPLDATVTGVEKFAFRYFDEQDRWKLNPSDAESLFVDPRTHNVFIVQKDLKRVDGTTKVARAFELKDQDLAGGRLNHAVHVADPVGAGDGVGTGPVAGDIISDGRWIVMKNYQEGFLWPRAKGQTVAQALNATPVAPCHVTVDGAEAITFGYSPDGVWTGFLSVRESKKGNPPLHEVSRAFASA
jgi:hypothetical protein